MDIERLKELKGITECLYQDGNVALTYCVDILVILDEAIARQSVKSEEVAISKTETTSARALSCWYCTEIEKHGVVAVKTVLDKTGRKLDAYETPYNYCPACGRRLKENEYDLS